MRHYVGKYSYNDILLITVITRVFQIDNSWQF